MLPLIVRKSDTMSVHRNAFTETVAKFIWFSETDRTFKAIRLLEEASVCITNEQMILIGVATDFIFKMASHSGMNAYTFLILLRERAYDLPHEVIDNAIILEYCIRIDSSDYYNAQKILELGTTYIYRELDKFLDKLSSENELLTPQLRYIEDLTYETDVS
jgi:hypothetical protein